MTSSREGTVSLWFARAFRGLYSKKQAMSSPYERLEKSEKSKTINSVRDLYKTGPLGDSK
jgi:hypothetical protein